MGAEGLLQKLPPLLAVAIRLRAAGHPDAVLSTAIGIPVEGVPVVIRIAQAKLRHLEEAQASAEQDQ